MKPFAELLDRLLYTPQRNAKLALVRDYLRDAPDPDRGWALAALTGELDFSAAKPGLIRELGRRRRSTRCCSAGPTTTSATSPRPWRWSGRRRPRRPAAGRELAEVVEALRTAARRPRCRG